MWVQQVAAQPFLDKTSSVAFENNTFSEALTKVENAYQVSFVYSSDVLPEKQLTGKYEKKTLKALLNEICSGNNLDWKVRGSSIVLVREKYTATLNGKIIDAENGEELIGVNLLILDKSTGVTTNLYGFYSLTLPKGVYSIKLSYIGYRPKDIEVDLYQDRRLDFKLEPVDLQLNEVVVEGKQEKEDINVSGLKTGNFSLTKDIAQQMPSFFGDTDPVRALQLLPGVQSGAEGSTGLFVRGGGADQNLILIDEAPVLNPSHFFNLFSIFNTDLLKEIEFAKGTMPAKYGNRLSSVLDVRLREGNFQEFDFSGSVGSLSTKLTLEGPLKKGKTSFIMSGRRTYADLLVKSIPNNSLSANALYFYDFNIKLDTRLSPKNSLSFSGYLGRDRFGFRDIYNVNWGNQTLSVRWNSILSKNLFLNSTAYGSYFRTRSGVSLQEEFAYSSRYNVRQYGLKQNLTWYIDPTHQFEMGYDINRQRFFFGEIQPLDENSIVSLRRIAPSYTRELAAYISYQQEIAKKLALNIGLRYAQYDNTGPGLQYLYDTERVVSPSTSVENIVDTIRYERGERFNTFLGLEPRITLRYLLGANSSFKLAYHRNRQYINLLSNTNVPSPVDMWAPVNSYIEPQIGDQYSLGFFKNLNDNMYELSVEAYYRFMRNQIDFKPLANLLLNDHLETEILSGSTQAYGAEFFFRKRKGRFKGWLSYTLSEAVSDIPGINNNQPYPTSYDRRHNLSIVSSYKVNRYLEISANWMFASGLAYSFPVGKYEKDQFIVPYYTSRNGFRLPPVHRLDVSATFYRKMSVNKKNESSFNFSIYNVYNRKNTYAYVFRQSREDRSKTEAVKLYLFTIIPSFTYNFKF